TQTFNMRYDEDWDAYFVGKSDAGDSFVQAIEYSVNEAGYIEALVALLYPIENDETAVDTTYLFTLAQNPYADGIAQPLFKFTVMDAKQSYTNTVRVTEIQEKDDACYATVDYMLQDSSGAWVVDEAGIEVRVSDLAQFLLPGIETVLEGVSAADAAADSNLFFRTHAATPAADGEHLLFYVNQYRGVVYGGEFAYEFYAK
ncbi:hypothetical protein LJC42_08095, partial [Eubacteriales bacterium OttesenSCG-928-K08]|nr:hypothetical protein [Eubacteriales bacterium OttesenSCG-928-K08]